MLLKYVKDGEFLYDKNNNHKTFNVELKPIYTKLRIELNKFNFNNAHMMELAQKMIDEKVLIDSEKTELILMNELEYLVLFAKLVMDTKPLTTDLIELINSAFNNDFWLLQDITVLRDCWKSFREKEATGGYQS